MTDKKIALCLGGYWGSFTDLTSNGDKGFEYIHENILKNNDVDIFIHSWDIEKKDIIIDMYRPWLKKAIIEPQINFNDVLKYHGFYEDLVLADAMKNSTYTRDNAWGGILDGKMKTRMPNCLSQAFTKSRSLFLKRGYETEKNIQYDSVIMSRFDLGQINNKGKWKVCNIDFDPKRNMSELHCAYWEDFNEGMPDIWFYSSSENMNKFIGLESRIIYWHLSSQEKDGYLDCATNGWVDSSATDRFSNEMFKEDKDKTKDLKKFTVIETINMAMFYKWDLILNGLYNNLNCIKMEDPEEPAQTES